MRTDAILVNELQLGNALSSAVTESRRSDFGLMLAMLVQDARCFAEFQLPSASSNPALSLRQRLQLPDEAPMVRQYCEDQRAIRCAEAFQQSGLTQSRLQQCLEPEPLELRGPYPFGLQQAFNNAEPWSQAMPQMATNPKPLPPHKQLADIIAEQRLQSAALVAVA
ncbi:VC2046/SO_2500 family protein [Ferrimonas senticii]|uniref:VC2046/SO_2500 family protein n=1 Tax=Ferrimonas senticii TaxID=394566 RepID=UPI0003F8F63D|nr:VC2046/SO_2500 family protein [Ferrimonas senticii]